MSTRLTRTQPKHMINIKKFVKLTVFVYMGRDKDQLVHKFSFASFMTRYSDTQQRGH